MKKQFYIGLCLLFILLNVGLGSWGLTESSEARYAEIGREMVVSGDYLHPRLMGISHYHKPPVTYYLTALGYRLFGINPFGARFFLSVSLIFQLLLVFKIALLLFRDERKAIISAVIYFSFPVVLIAARDLTTDCYLTTFILAALYFWLVRKQGGGRFNLYLFYVFLGIGFLTKGPVVWLPPVVFIACYKFVHREKIRITLDTVLGTLLLLVIAASWFVAVVIDHPTLWDYFIEKQIVARSVSAESFHRSKPFWYYLVFAPLLGLPFFAFILMAFVRKYRLIMKKHGYPRIIALTIGVLLVIFSVFSSKLILYILPLYPFIALLGGYLLLSMPRSFYHLGVKVYAILCTVFAILFLGLHVYVGYELSLTTAIILASALFILTIALLAARSFSVKRRLFAGALGFSLALIYAYMFFGLQNPYTINSVHALMAQVKKTGGDMLKDVYIYDERLPSAQFYLGRPVVSMANTNYRAQRETGFETGSTYRKYYYDLRDKARWKELKINIDRPGNVLILKESDVLPDSLSFLKKGFDNEFVAGKWRVYY